jgi:hypothetical protein
MDLTLREEYWINLCMKLVAVITPISTTGSFITLLVNWYKNGLIPLIRQFFHIPNRINDIMDLGRIFTIT